MVAIAVSDRWMQQGRSAELLDRVLIGFCAAIWLVLLGVGVAATVALSDLGRSVGRSTQGVYTGVLYAIIGVSALIILAAIPLLVRSRKQGVEAPGNAPGQGRSARLAAKDPARPVGRLQRGEAERRLANSEVDRVLLRGGVELTSGIGVALIGVAVATYLMAVGKDTSAWASYGLAAVVTATLPAIPWLYLRELRSVLNLSGLG